jgi:hypothetical protein
MMRNSRLEAIRLNTIKIGFWVQLWGPILIVFNLKDRNELLWGVTHNFTSEDLLCVTICRETRLFKGDVREGKVSVGNRS